MQVIMQLNEFFSCISLNAGFGLLGSQRILYSHGAAFTLDDPSMYSFVRNVIVTG